MLQSSIRAPFLFEEEHFFADCAGIESVGRVSLVVMFHMGREGGERGSLGFSSHVCGLI